MNDERVIRTTAAELSTHQDVTEGNRIEARTDAQIERAISEDPDAAPILDEEFWTKARLLDPSRVGRRERA